MRRFTVTVENQKEVVKEAAKVLSQGGLILYPTETMYGVGVDATNPEAVSRLLKYKNRPAGKPISVMVNNQEEAEKLVMLNFTAQNLYQTFLPGPVTVISQSRGLVDRRLESEFQTLGIRISSHPFVQALTSVFQLPITATSANASGKARPYSTDQALEGLSEIQKSLIDLIIDAGSLPPREPSTVIDTTQEVQEIVRVGEKFTEIMPAITTSSEVETRNLGLDLTTKSLHVLIGNTLVFALEGEMGAGKTQFTKGVAEALGIERSITSPTYTLVKEYQSLDQQYLIHLDCWRLGEVNPEELELDQYAKPQTILVIEWAAPLLDYLKTHQSKVVGYHIFFEIEGENQRRIRIEKL